MLAETLPDLKDLRELDLTGFDHFENLDFLSECTQIEELTIWDSQVEDIRGIQNMENLRILDLNLNPFTDISPLQNLKHLEAVNLCWVPVENLEILTMIPSPEAGHVRTSFTGGGKNFAEIRTSGRYRLQRSL